MNAVRPAAGRTAALAGLGPLWLALGGILAGLGLRLAGRPGAAELLWAATAAGVLLPLAARTARSLRRRELGVDLIALAAIVVALVLRQYLAGAVVALMMSGGQALEGFAARRARRDLARLLGRAPATARRFEGGGYREVPVDAVAPGDRLLIRMGDILPVDGVVQDHAAVIDESALTGEPLPVERPPGERVRSGTVNAGPGFELLAAATARDSTYARILRLVDEAERAKAPFVRLADRYARVFLPLTAAFSLAAWGISGEPLRALAVLVVATPCPLILAAPVAFLAGLSRAARRGVIVKGGRALEALAAARVVLIDKTGTVTAGQARVASVHPSEPTGEAALLAAAASLDQVSTHVFAGPIVAAARARGFALVFPTAVAEEPGRGITGAVGARQVALGSLRWLAGRGIEVTPTASELQEAWAQAGDAGVAVAIDGRLAGLVRLEDPMRADAPEVVAALRRAGIGRVVLVTGDLAAAAARIGARLGVDRVLAECSPAEKVAAVREEGRRGATAMIGDGLNDAPALAAAGVGVAIAPRGAAAPAEAADIVLISDDLGRVVETLAIARRSHSIARQSVLAGMGLSLAAMAAAAAGWLTPLAGALVQEAVDLGVILNALRALTAGPTPGLAHPSSARPPTSRGVATIEPCL